MAKTFYVIDGHYQVFRAYYAPFGDLSSPSGEPTRATYVFTSMLLKLIWQAKPDYLAIAMDSGRENLRRTQLYPEYKATRAEPPEDLRPQIQRIIQIIQAMRVPLLQKTGVEADDIMATIARRLAGGGVRIVLVSRDKDLEQLLGEHVVLYDPTKDEIIDAARLEQVKGYPPEKAAEVQALCGDSTDNVPGIPGVGPKTAARLIGRYGSAEAVLEHADELTGKLAENVRKHAENVLLARKLVTLDDDVDMDVQLAEFSLRGVRVAAARPIFVELGFSRILDQLDSPATGQADRAVAEPAPPPAGRTTTKDFDYRCVDTPESLEKLMGELKGVSRLAVDTETTSTQPMWAELVGISLSFRCGHGCYLPLAVPLGGKASMPNSCERSWPGCSPTPGSKRSVTISSTT